MPEAGINLKTDDGIAVFVPIEFASMSEGEKTAFLKLASSMDKSKLSAEELALLESRKTYATGEGAPAGLICRWDWTFWVV